MNTKHVLAVLTPDEFKDLGVYRKSGYTKSNAIATILASREKRTIQKT